MPIINSIASWLMIKRLTQIDLMKKYPHNVQRDTFIKLISKAKNTEWGIKYDYESINTVKKFQERVPLQDYEDVKPYIFDLKKGKSNLLWPGSVKWFAKSSGTTSDKSKFIPVTKESLEDCHFRGGKDVLAIYNSNNPDSKIFSGKGLTLGGSQQINNIDNQSYYGDLSALMIKNVPFWAEFLRTPSNDIALMSEWEEKIEKITKVTIKENVTNISGVPSWVMVLIKYILDYTKSDNLLEVWPNLELFMHGGVSFKPYREIFKNLIPSDKMNYMETYNASEGFFAIQDNPYISDLLLMLDYGVFYEFIPMEKNDLENPPVYTLEDIEINKNYSLVISSNNGLWRYKIGDTIMFTSKFPYRIKITGRVKHFINAFGEELIIDNAEKALEIACKRTNAKLTEYTAAPVYMQENTQGTHEWFFEFEKEPKNMDYFMELMDNALKSLNSDYEAKRYKNMTLVFPKHIIAKQGTFYKWLKKKGKLGGQNKVPRLSNERKYIVELININNE